MRILGIDNQLYSCSQAYFQEKKSLNNGIKENIVDILDTSSSLETTSATSGITEPYQFKDQQKYGESISELDLTEIVNLGLSNTLQEQNLCKVFDDKCKIDNIHIVLKPEKQTIVNQFDNLLFLSGTNKQRKQSFLIQTIGSTTVDQVRGDGAYAQWMNDYFQQNKDFTGFKHHWIDIPGKGNNVNPDLKNIFCNELDKFLKENNANSSDLLILNWHIRCTGRPNAYTGRGLPELLDTLMDYNKNINLKIVLTIHESEGIGNTLDKILPQIDSIITLNPNVKDEISGLIKAKNKNLNIYLSSVPNLMSSTATKATDKILEYIGNEPLLNLNLAGACVISKLKERNRTYASKNIEDITKINSTSKNKRSNIEQLRNLKRGIVMFGSVVTRHGTTKENIENLCIHLKKKENLKNFPVVISGSQPDQKLIEDIASIDSSKDSIIITGTIDNFDVLANCKYAISFDTLGFRDNASAMVNVIRSGHLLFCRKQNENDPQLIERATREISLCEINNGHYIKLLEEQQSDFRRLNTKLVGDELCDIFQKIANTEETPIEIQFSKLAISKYQNNYNVK